MSWMKVMSKSNPPLEGGSKFASIAKQISGRGKATQVHPSPKNASHFSTLPQGEGWYDT